MSTCVTEAILLTSLVTAATQCPHVMPCTEKVVVIMPVSYPTYWLVRPACSYAPSSFFISVISPCCPAMIPSASTLASALAPDVFSVCAIVTAP